MSKHLGSLASAAALSLLLYAPAFAQQGQEPAYRPHMWNGGWQGWFFGPIMMIVFLAVAVIVIVLLVRWLGWPGHGNAPQHSPSRTPLDILKERFAKGEIDKQEFEERRRVLGE
ncbi:MAG: SHOCT domain-containing protein [Henriciella sp.]